MREVDFRDPDFPGQTIERQVLQDVDEDGGPEELVSFRELCGARNCSWAIYATNDGCSRYVGMLEGSSWTVRTRYTPKAYGSPVRDPCPYRKLRFIAAQGGLKL